MQITSSIVIGTAQAFAINKAYTKTEIVMIFIIFVKNTEYPIDIKHDTNDMIETTKITDIVNRIAIRFNPDKIILFGSYATGNPNKDSDLDLLIIKDTDLPRHRRSFDIQKLLIGSMIPMDILVYTNDEFEQEQNERYSFLNSAIKTSKILYERR